MNIVLTASKSREEMCTDLCCEIDKATGTSFEVGDRIVSQMANAFVSPKPQGDDEVLIKSIATVAEYAPRNITEANLAVQMTATHELALMLMNRAKQADRLDLIDVYLARATRLMRLHLDQIEAMQKLKGKAGHQTVTVEHVHVHEGGQAIVGAVNASRGEGGGK